VARNWSRNRCLLHLCKNGGRGKNSNEWSRQRLYLCLFLEYLGQNSVGNSAKQDAKEEIRELRKLKIPGKLKRKIKDKKVRHEYN